MSHSPALDKAVGPDRGGWLRLWALICVLAAYGYLQLGGLGHPLFWQDEGETAMFGQRVLQFGYPKVHADGNTVFGMGVPLAFAVDAESDAYLGSFWGQYYLAALGVGLAEGGTDLYRRTAWVRAPFVLSGLLGLGLLWWAVQPGFAGRRGARMDSAIGFGLLLCLSVSLMLHLREVRYYGPSLALLAGGVWLQLRVLMRSAAHGGWATPREAMLAFLLCLLLFNFFFPAAVALSVWWGLEAIRGIRRLPGSRAARLSLLAPAAVALLLFGLAAFCLIQLFGTAVSSRILSERWSFGPGVYLGNLGHLLVFLFRYEWLAPWLLAEMALWGVTRQATAEAKLVLAAPLAIRAAVLRLCLIYTAVAAANPIFFERYFVPLGPLLALILLLDLEALRRGIGQLEPASRRASVARVGLAVGCLSLLALGLMRGPELLGRMAEIRHPVEGPVDASIRDLREHYADPASLTIATNYEAEAYMFYLGSRVVGRFHDGTPEADAVEAAVQPDLVIPRSAQPRSLARLRRYLLTGEFKRRELAVADVAYNNIPELYAGRVLSTVHRFETPRPGESGPPLAIYERIESAP